MSDINLLPRGTKVSYGRKVLQIIRATSGAFLFIVVLFSLAVFIGKLASPLPALKTQEQSLLAGLSATSTKIASLLTVHDRLGQIQGILTNRIDHAKMIELLISRLPATSDITGISVDKEKLTVTIVTSDLSAIDSYFNDLNGLVSKEKIFKRVVLENLILDKSAGQYSLSIEGYYF